MHRFAHLADAHLGAHREPNLQRLELSTFDDAMSKCVDLGVDFVVVSGDLFHVGIPDLGVVNAALRSMMRLQREGIPIYAIYGSHDYTPNGTSVIDILNTVGVLSLVFKPKMEEGRLRLEVTTDEKTGAKLVGVSARRIGLESKYFEVLDRADLEEVEGFKVFAFHSGLTELKPPHLSEMETISVKMLPEGFDYYAGGHIHERGVYDLEGRKNIVFPGPLFTGYGKDLEATSKGEKRGFYIVDFDDAVRGKKFVPLSGLAGVYREYDLGGMSAKQANEFMARDIDGLEVQGKVVVMRVFGELAGRTSDIEFGRLKVALAEAGAIHVYLNRNALKSKEASSVVARGKDVATTEREHFVASMGAVNVASGRLRGERGVETAMELLRILKQQPKLGESKKDYLSRMVATGENVIGVGEEAGV